MSWDELKKGDRIQIDTELARGAVVGVVEIIKVMRFDKSDKLCVAVRTLEAHGLIPKGHKFGIGAADYVGMA